MDDYEEKDEFEHTYTVTIIHDEGEIPEEILYEWKQRFGHQLCIKFLGPEHKKRNRVLTIRQLTESPAKEIVEKIFGCKHFGCLEIMCEEFF